MALIYSGSGTDYEIIDCFQYGKFWIVETPSSDIHMTNNCFFVMTPASLKRECVSVVLVECGYKMMLMGEQEFFIVDILHGGWMAFIRWNEHLRSEVRIWAETHIDERQVR